MSAVYLIVVIVMILSIQRAADSLSDTRISAVLAGGETQLLQLERKLGRFDRRINNLLALTYPFRQIARVAVIIPPLERQRLAAELLVVRAGHDQVAAHFALKLGRLSIALQNDFLGDAGFANDDRGRQQLGRSLAMLASSSEELIQQLKIASATGTEIEQLVDSGPVLSLSSRMSEQESRLTQVANFSLLLSATLTEDLSLVAQTTSLFDEARQFLAGELTIDEFGEKVRIIGTDARRARELAVRMVAAAPLELKGTEYGDLIETIESLNVAIDDLLTGVDGVLQAAGESFNAIESSEGGLFDDGKAITKALRALIEQEELLGESARMIDRSISLLVEISDSSVFSLGESGKDLTSRIDFLKDMSMFLELFPRLAGEVLGIDGEERKYFVLGQTSDELRAVGGLTSSTWLLTFKSGALIGNDYFEIVGFEDPETLELYPEAYPELQLHMDAGRMYVRDVGWDPHFESVGELAADLYEVRTSTKVDGVISLTQWAIIDLVTTLGGLETESGFIRPDELMSLIEKSTDDVGTRFLATLFSSFMDSLSGDRVKDNFIELITAVTDLFASKDLMMYSEHSAVQKQISAIGWDGSLPNSSTDRLAIIDSNVGWNKIDRNVERSFVYEVDLSDISTPVARLSLKYDNVSSVDDNYCGVQKHVPNTYDVALNGCYWNYFRVYVPSGSLLVGGDELPLGRETIASRVVGLTAGRRTLLQMSDENGDYISGLLSVDPATSRIVNMEYRLPVQVLVMDGEFIEYSLALFMQAGSRRRSGSVILKLPSGYEIVEFKPAARKVSEVEWVVDLDLTADVTIELKILRSTN